MGERLLPNYVITDRYTDLSGGIPWSTKLIEKPGCNRKKKRSRRQGSGLKGPGRFSGRPYWWRELILKQKKLY